MDFERLLDRMLGRKVAPVDVKTLKGDASSRRYHRVYLPEGMTPQTLIVMELPSDGRKSDEAMNGDAPDELPFINVGRHLAKAGLRVPDIYLDGTKEGAVLLEDLGDMLFVDAVRYTDEDTVRDWYAAAVDLMVKMHRSMWPIPDTCIASKRRFGFDLLRWELDHFREWGLEALQGKSVGPALRARLDRAFDALAEEIAELPLGFVHRDYQSRNLMLRHPMPVKESLAIIDFQDALSGPRVYDLVALLNDSYVSLSEKLKEELVARYAEQSGIAYGSLLDEFHLVTVQRKLKDGGRFIFIDRVKGNPAFLEFVDKSFIRVRASLDRILGREELKSILAEVDPVRFG